MKYNTILRWKKINKTWLQMFETGLRHESFKINTAVNALSVNKSS
jgi:hypothetical protein